MLMSLTRDLGRFVADILSVRELTAV